MSDDERVILVTLVAVVIVAVCGLRGCESENRTNVEMAKAGMEQRAVAGINNPVWVRADTCGCAHLKVLR